MVMLFVMQWSKSPNNKLVQWFHMEPTQTPPIVSEPVAVPTPVTPTTPAKLQAHVDYLPGITIFGAQTALLEWSADDHIKFFKMNPDTQQATEVLFDVPLSQIEAVSGSMVMLTFKVAGKKYNAQFSRTAIAGLGVGGVAGLAASAALSHASGIYAWINMLKEHGVNMKGWKGWIWTIIVALIIVAVIIAGVVVYVLVAHNY
ncbi:MAG: hypothetical protein JWM52_362 [Candidatus Saccharibacteria bacterium]|nr:hypothetical protein [Candidatus Saccharibacteria bacterium]